MKSEIRFILNGNPVAATVGSGDNVIDLLNRLDLYGARESCGQGLCGCCTVYVDDEPISGCLQLALLVDGKNVATIEGLGQEGELHPVQQAFIDAGAFQCGFCTPGFIMMVNKLLETDLDADDDQIKHYLSGNLCRCSAYADILRAVHLSIERMGAAPRVQADSTN